MRLNSYYLTIGITILLWSFPTAGTVSAQECPTIEVNCTSRIAGDSAPLRCSANVGGDTADMKLTYQWSIAPSVPLINIPDRPDEVEVNLSNNPDHKITVTLTIGGLPKDCPNTSEYESLPVKPDNVQLAPLPLDLPPTSVRSITGTCSESVLEDTAAYFSINVGDVGRDVNLTYSWTLSRGKLKSGQGTPSIIVDTTDLGGEIVTATARVSGLNVALKVSCTTMINRIPKAYKLAEISNKSPDEESEQLRRFALRLNIGLDERAYIVALGRRGQSTEEIKKRATLARDYLIEQYGVAPSRIMGIGVGFGNDETIQLWVIQTGAMPPRNSVKIR